MRANGGGEETRSETIDGVAYASSKVGYKRAGEESVTLGKVSTRGRVLEELSVVRYRECDSVGAKSDVERPKPDGSGEVGLGAASYGCGLDDEAAWEDEGVDGAATGAGSMRTKSFAQSSSSALLTSFGTPLPWGI